jgi:hypothetical protein
VEGTALRESGLVGMPEIGEGDVIKDCTFIRAGLNAAGSTYYTPEFLKAHVARFEGSLCHLDHPTLTESRVRPERSLSSIAAHTANARWDETQQAVVGDIKLLSGTAPAEHVRGLFRSDVVRETAGLSIYWPHRYNHRFAEMQGRRVTVPTELVGPESMKLNLDFVTLPTAGGRVGRVTA